MPRGRDRSGDPGNDLTREGIFRRMKGAAQNWLNGGEITPEQQARYNDRMDRRDNAARSRATFPEVEGRTYRGSTGSYSEVIPGGTADFESPEDADARRLNAALGAASRLGVTPGQAESLRRRG